MSDSNASSLSGELLTRHQEQQSKSPSPAPAVTSNLPSLPKLGASSLPSLPRKSNGGVSWRDALLTPSPPPTSSSASKVRARATESLTLPDADKARQSQAVTQIQKKYGVSIEGSRSSSGSITFLIRGSQPGLGDAKRELSHKLSPRLTKTIEIPAEARPAILGAKGAALRGITDATETKINIGNSHETESSTWTMHVVPIEITGSQSGVEEAIEKVQEIVKTRVQFVKSSLKTPVPASLVPFLQAYAKSLDQVSSGKAKVSISSSGAVDVSGEPASILAVSSALDKYASDSESTFATRPASIDAQSADFLATDSVFEDTRVVLSDGKLYGPSSKLDSASKALKKLTEDLVIASLDISRAHNKSPEHAKIVAACLAKTGTLKTIEKDTGVHIKVPSGSFTYLIGSSDRNAVSKAKKALIEKVNEISPDNVAVTSGFKTSIARANAVESLKDVQKEKFVLPLIDSDQTILVYLGNDEDFAPSADEIHEVLNSVIALLKPAQELEKDSVEKSISVPASDQRYLREPLGSAKILMQKLTKTDEGLPLVTLSFNKKVIISGLSEKVSELEKAIPEIIEKSKDYQQRSNYSESFNFNPKHVKNLIGRNGANITKLREEFGVKIDVSENGQVTLKGLEPKVKKARAKIEATETRLNDEVVEKFSVPQKYHSLLIGNKGKFVRRIKEKYDVHVQFPKPSSESVNGAEEGKSPAPEGEDNDTIVLTGPSQGVKQTKKEFQDLVDYEVAHSQTEELEVPANTLNRVIGRQGSNINAIKQSTGADIEILRSTNENGQVTIKLLGEKKAIQAAAKKIQASVDEIVDTVEKKMEVDPKYHRFIVGPNNETRRSIIEKAGGQVDPWNPRMLQVPSSTSNSTTIKMLGPSKVVAAIETQIKELVEKFEAKERNKTEFEIPADQFTVLLGPGGSRKRGVEEKTGATIDISRGSGSKPCKITVKAAEQSQVDEAKSEILAIVNVGKASLEVPANLASDLFNFGMLAKQLEEKYDVKLNIGKSAFPKDSRTPPKAPANLKDKGHATEFAPFTAPADNDKKFVWSVVGKDEESCEKAIENIKERIAALESFDTIGYVWFAKPSQFSQIIGPMGVTINSIRQQSGCVIFVPKQAQKNLSPIEVLGVKEQVEKTCQILIDEVTYHA